MKPRIAIVLSLLALLGLRAADLPAGVFVSLKDDWGDAHLRAVSVQKKEGGSIVIEASAPFDGQAMGFRVVILPEWKSWKTKDWPIDSFQGVIRLESTGKPSEVFIRCLAQAYKQKVEKIDFSSVELSAITLEGDPRQIATHHVKLKLFFESEQADAYAEAFLNFDLGKSLVEFHEKDHAYRKPVLGFLTRGKEANQALLQRR